MISIHYISIDTLDKVKPSVEALINAINTANALCQCIVVCAGPMDVRQYMLDAKIMSKCRPMRSMTYVQAKEGTPMKELVKLASDTAKKLRTYKEITHNVIIHKSEKLKPASLRNLINKLNKHMMKDEPLSFLMFKEKKKEVV